MFFYVNIFITTEDGIVEKLLLFKINLLLLLLKNKGRLSKLGSFDERTFWMSANFTVQRSFSW